MTPKGLRRQRLKEMKGLGCLEGEGSFSALRPLLSQSRKYIQGGLTGGGLRRGGRRGGRTARGRTERREDWEGRTVRREDCEGEDWEGED